MFGLKDIKNLFIFVTFELCYHYIVYRLVGIFSCINLSCGRQEEPAILISRLLLRMRRMYVDVDSIHLYFH